MNALHTNLKELSLKVGKEQSYLHQFMWRRKPATLKPPIRVKLASLLHVAPDDLDVELMTPRAFPRVLPPQRPTLRLASPAPAPAPAAALRAPVPAMRSGIDMLPHFADVDDIEPPSGGRWDSRQGRAGLVTIYGAAFSLSITKPRGRLRADMVIVKLGQPRIGDMVVVLRGKRVAAIGELCGLTHEDVTVSTSDMQQSIEPEAFPRATVQLLKVAAAEFA